MLCSTTRLVILNTHMPGAGNFCIEQIDLNVNKYISTHRTESLVQPKQNTTTKANKQTKQKNN